MTIVIFLGEVAAALLPASSEGFAVGSPEALGMAIQVALAVLGLAGAWRGWK